MSIGEKIRNLRKNKGLTQRELSKEINFSSSYIGDLESNRTNPSIKTLEVLSKYFQVETSFFFESKCCYIKFLDGEGNFCKYNESQCKACPLRIAEQGIVLDSQNKGNKFNHNRREDKKWR